MRFRNNSNRGHSLGAGKKPVASLLSLTGSGENLKNAGAHNDARGNYPEVRSSKKCGWSREQMARQNLAFSLLFPINRSGTSSRRLPGLTEVVAPAWSDIRRWQLVALGTSLSRSVSIFLMYWSLRSGTTACMPHAKEENKSQDRDGEYGETHNSRFAAFARQFHLRPARRPLGAQLVKMGGSRSRRTRPFRSRCEHRSNTFVLTG